MAALIYRFRNFRLESVTREIRQDELLIPLPVSTVECLTYLIEHRDRFVGRDELTAAVWGRVDVSEATLSHTIMRLRRILGDSGSLGNSIRTVPRLGYRWVVETQIEQAPAQALTTVSEEKIASPSPSSAPELGEVNAVSARAQTLHKSRRPSLVATGWGIASLFGALAVFGIARYLHRESSDVPVGTFVRMPVMVLPADVHASDDWTWLRLGLMDLVANRLRMGDLAVAPSETVISLVDAHRLDWKGASQDKSSVASLLIRPRVTQIGGKWDVQLEATDKQHPHLAQAQSDDVLTAGRQAADKLLVELGHTPPPIGDADPSQVEELAQRVNAALLAGQLTLARSLLRDAPPEVRASPEIALSAAVIEFVSGHYETTRQQIEALLDHLPAEKNPVLRARALNRLGATYFRQNRIDDADAAYSEAIQLLETRNDAEALAAAYIGRGIVAGQKAQLDTAAAYFGRARTLHEMSNDEFGVARVDLNLGEIASNRNQPAAALSIFEDAAEHFERLGAQDALAAALESAANAELRLLKFDQALSTTERFWPVEAHSSNQRQRWSLVLMRARALAGKGRLSEAEGFVQHIRAASDPKEDADLRAETDIFAADLALQRGNYGEATALAATVLTPAFEKGDPTDYRSAWRVQLRGLQLEDQVSLAADEVKRLRAWAETAADREGLSVLYVTLAEADQAWIEGHQDIAFQRYADAMGRAERIGVPEDIVAVGEPYVRALVTAGQTDQATAVGGRIAQWADQDLRAALTQVRVYQALNQPAAARAAFEHAKQIAGERVLPASLDAIVRKL
jgi:DNA-binding winged helix-turn-helix (wHTH) protein/tetratricopeptide (TPR) repeat protein